MRRILAFMSWLAGAVLAVLALPRAEVGWTVYIPSMAFLGFSALMLFFTTWADLRELALALKGTK